MAIPQSAGRILDTARTGAGPALQAADLVAAIRDGRAVRLDGAAGELQRTARRHAGPLAPGGPERLGAAGRRSALPLPHAALPGGAQGIPGLGLRYDAYALLISAVSWVLVPLFQAGLTGIVRQRK